MTRECGSCTACCELLEIVELEKPRGILCQHCTSGQGCAIYATRPKSAATTVAGWRMMTYRTSCAPTGAVSFLALRTISASC
jgi:hypothetical protein